MALRRVNYYEDFQFIGLFDPHPDYGLAQPQTMRVTGEPCKDLGWLVTHQMIRLKLEGWFQKAGSIVAGGTPIASFVGGDGSERVAKLLAARSGRFTALSNDFSEGPLYQIEYFEGSGPSFDPFVDLRRFAENIQGGLKSSCKEIEVKRMMVRWGVWIPGLIAALLLFAVANGSGVALFFFLLLGGTAIGMGVWSSRLSAKIRMHNVSTKLATTQLYESYRKR